jgi:phospholipid/cholesterol/gamma-HCH transport system substrate-binding protein
MLGLVETNEAAMSNNAIETVMGAVVLAVAGGFLYFAYNNSNVRPVEGYALSADFANVSGIAAGSDVRIGGIKVGVVENLDINPKTYQAVATLRVDEKIQLPKDSSAAIQSSGLLGDKFVTLEPGGDEVMMKDGDHITYTQSSVSIEEMIGKFVFSGGGADKGGDDKASDSATSSGLQ